ncbi:hypothetical protein HID58_019743, partial [Brassica napus]
SKSRSLRKKKKPKPPFFLRRGRAFSDAGGPPSFLISPSSRRSSPSSPSGFAYPRLRSGALTSDLRRIETEKWMCGFSLANRRGGGLDLGQIWISEAGSLSSSASSVVCVVLVKPVSTTLGGSSELPPVPSHVGLLRVLRSGSACEEVVAGVVNHGFSFRWRRVRICKFQGVDLGLPLD